LCVFGLLHVSRLVKQQSLELYELQPLLHNGGKACRVHFLPPLSSYVFGRGVCACVYKCKESTYPRAHIQNWYISLLIADCLFIKEECKLCKQISILNRFLSLIELAKMQNRLAFKATLTRSFSEINIVFYPILLFRYNSYVIMLWVDSLKGKQKV